MIILVGLILCFEAFAEESVEPNWKSKLRSVITQVAGAQWGDKLLGPVPEILGPQMALPEIPKQAKNSTDVGSYTKIYKEPTEYDKLPAEKKRKFDYLFVEELFRVTRKTEPKDEDLSNWLNTLEQGGSREGIYQALVLDEVYSGLEGMEEKPSQKLLDFSLKFSQSYLNETFNQDSLKDLNLYSLKRIFTEKSLDLMEYFEVKDLDALYRWYAVFSANLAKEHAPSLKSKIRQDPTAEFHYEWAKGMPIQHIKSEFIIKFHTVMNGLQTANP